MSKKLSEENSFGQWLRKRRRTLDLTQQDLADQVGCARITLRRIEADALRPSKELALILLEKLGIPEPERSKWILFARGNWEASPTSRDEDAPWPASQIHLATFLFTDIEDSAKLWENAPEQMKVALQHHHAILQEAITSNSGNVFQIVGDAFCAAFPTAPSAISAAVTAQRRLDREQWDLPFPIRVRIGIHTGEAQPIPNDSITGGYKSNQSMNRVARILQAGHGGQVLLSLATKELAKDSMPADTELRDMGEHYLRNLIHPEHLFQLNIAGLPSDFPPLNTVSSTRHNLPVQLTSFIGREKELADIHKLLGDTHLLTLVGPGGVGKTRLSIQAAQEVLEEYPDGAWLVELAPILDPLLIPRTTAITIGLRDEPQRPILDMLCDYLRPKKMLLILDNCEHLVEAVASMADKLLRAAPNLRILSSSREVLGITGEVTYLVPSFGMPEMGYLPSFESLSQYEALKLFIDRAAAAVPSFSVTNDNVLALAQICHHLDGIPLAIELAAAKVRVLSLEQINARLDDRFSLLKGGSRTALPRHQTLQAAIDWSYDLLSPAEQTLFQRLSVFINGWTLEAAESVCSDANIKPEDVLDLLTLLINKSLANTEELQSETRYRMLETIREYAREKLSKSNEVENLRQQHCDFFIQFVEQAEPKLKGTEQMEWLDRLEIEHDNLRAALACALQQNTAESILRFGGALWRFWRMRSYWREGTEWLEKALAKTSEQSVLRANALHGLSVLVLYQGDLISARSLIDECLALRQAIGDKRDIAESLALLGVVARNEGDYLTARSLTEQSLILRRSLGDTWGIAESLRDLANVVRNQGDYTVARSLDKDSLELWRKLDNKWGIAFALYGQGLTAMYQGDYQHATALLKESLIVAEELKDKHDIAFALYRLGEVSQCRDDYEQAEIFYEKSLLLFRDLGDEQSQVGLHCRLGHIALRRGNYERAKVLFRKSLSDLQKRDQKQEIAMSLAGLAEVATEQGLPFHAARLFGATEALVEAVKASMNPVELIAYYRSLDTFLTQLDQATFAEAWAEGEKMSLNEVLDLALKTVDEM